MDRRRRKPSVGKNSTSTVWVQIVGGVEDLMQGGFYQMSYILLCPVLVSHGYRPNGELHQPGGVLVHHALHLVLQGPLPIWNEQLPGLTATLLHPVCSGLHGRARHTECHLECLGSAQVSITSSRNEEVFNSRKYYISLRFKMFQYSDWRLQIYWI